MPSKRPLLFCLTATRNYGWVTRAFLKANSTWADYIIVVDQMSTDGTREMCAEYENVILVDNTDTTYSETVRNTLAINRAREIDGDKILVGLDIDEVLPANWQKTEDGKRILQSSPGDMFIMNWANICPDKKHYQASFNDNLYRIFHDDGVSAYDNQGRDMHTHNLPWCRTGKEYLVKDFPILHFSTYNTGFLRTKEWYYYQMVDYDLNHRSPISLSRYYRLAGENGVASVGQFTNPQWFWGAFDIFELIDLETPPLFWPEIRSFLEKKGARHYRRLDIWAKQFLKETGVHDPRSIWDKAIHSYLHSSARHRHSYFIRAIDKLLKRLY